MKMRILFLLPIASLAVVKASKWPLRATHRDDIPASFDCAMRKAAYEYGKKLLPRLSNFPELYYALDLNSEDCHSELEEEFPDDGILFSPSFPASNLHAIDVKNRNLKLVDDRSSKDDITAPRMFHTASFPLPRKKLRDYSSSQQETYPSNTAALDDIGLPLDAVYVAVNGHDDLKHPKVGAKERPFQSIQSAIDYAASYSQSKVVVLRGGTHFITKTIQFEPVHNGLRIRSFPGESPIVSGGKQLRISSWKRYQHPKMKHKTSSQSPSKSDSDSNIWVTDISGQVDDVPGLQIDGKRATRARYPNLPGGIEVSCGYGCMIAGNLGNWTPPQLDRYGNVTYYTDNITAHDRPDDGWFEHYMIGLHGLCSVYDPPVSYWCSEKPSGGGAFAFRTPSGVTPINISTTIPNAPYANNASGAILFVWRPGRWANWMFELDSYDPETGNFTFGKGGNQGARGEDVGGDFFIENLLEELDYPNEFYFDKSSSQLYLFYNGTGAPPDTTTFVVPQLRVLFNMTGTQWNPVQNILISGLTFMSSRYTYMDPHGVPSAGDWALERSAAIFLQGTEQVIFADCIMERLDGNGLMISGYNRNTTIRNSDFSYIGGSAIASWGYTNETATDPGRPGILLENWPMAGVDGTDGEHPEGNLIIGCTAREVGHYEKQSSFYVQAKTARSTITNNVFFNGPRAGINMNDGFGGGDEISHNLVFSTCRESGDHGPFNSWDRQPFLTLVEGDDGHKKPSMIMEWREIHHNFFIDNYSPQEDVDNDDGSGYYKTHHNFLVYGRTGQKSDFGGHDNHHYRNVYGYVGSALVHHQEGHAYYFYENRVIITGDTVGQIECGNGPKKPIMHDNKYYTASGDIKECGSPLADWQKHGEDTNSTVHRFVDDDVVIGWARELLDF